MAKQVSMKLSWFPPRKCWKKKIQGKVYYFKGDGSGKKTRQSEKAALGELMELLTQEHKKTQEEYNNTIQEKESKIEEIEQEKKDDFDKFKNAVINKYGIVYFEKEFGDNSKLEDGIKKYINVALQRYKNREIKISTFEHLRIMTLKISSILRELKVVDIVDINERILLDYAEKVKSKKNISPTSKQHLLKYTKSFLNFCWENGLLPEMPRNIKTFAKMKISQKDDIDYFNIQELKELFDECRTDRQRLFFLLMLNCGFSYQDISDLKQEEYNGRYIKRKRSKTGIYSEFYLFDKTIELIEKEKSNDDKILFLGKRGNRLLHYCIKNGKQNGTNAIALTLGRRLFKKESVKSLLKKWDKKGNPYMLRKSGATAIANIADEATAQLYLAHAPATTAAKHYIKRDYSDLTKALKILEEKLSL